MRRLLVEAPDEAFGYADPQGRPELRTALDGLGGYRFSDDTAAPGDHQPALVIGYGSPAGRSYRGAVAALGACLHSAYARP
jgi:hypothetical protein